MEEKPMLGNTNADIALGAAVAIVFLRWGDEIPIISMLHKPVINFVNSTGY
jgi:hypothetical protein